MKKTIVVILVIIAASVGSTHWVGKQIEEKLPTFLQRAAQIGQFDIELTSYNRGTFRSTALTTLTFQGVRAEQLVLQHEIWHGPLPIGRTLDGQWSFSPAAAVIESTLPAGITQPGTIGELLDLLPGFATFHEVTTLSLSGAATSRISIPPFEQQLDSEGNKINFVWGGLKATEHFSADLTSVEGEASISRIRINDPTSEGEVVDLATTFRIYEDTDGLLLGNVTLDSSSIAFGTRGLPPEFSIKGLQLRNAASLEGGFANYAIEIAADELNNPTMSFAPVGFEILFSRLDATTILGVQRRLQNLQTNMANLSENDIIQQVANIYLDALPILIRNKPEISLNYLRAQNPDGELWAKGKITLTGEDKMSLKSFDDLSRLIQAEGETQIDSALLLSLTRRTFKPGLEGAWNAGQLGEISEDELNNMIDLRSQQQIDDLVTQGVLSYDGKRYNVNFLYQNQQMTLNGQTLSN